MDKRYLMLFIMFVVFLVLIQVNYADDYTVGVSFKHNDEANRYNQMIKTSIEVQNNGDIYIGEDYEEYLGKYLRRTTSRNLGKEEYVASNIRLELPEYYNVLHDLEELKNSYKILESQRSELRDKLLASGATYNLDRMEIEYTGDSEVDEVLDKELKGIVKELQDLDDQISTLEEDIEEQRTKLTQLERVKERAMNYLGIEYELEVEDPEVTYKRSIVRLITLRNYKNLGRYDFLDSFGYSEDEVKGLKEYLGGSHSVDEMLELEVLKLSYLTERNVYFLGEELKFDLDSEIDRDIVLEEIESKWGVD